MNTSEYIFLTSWGILAYILYLCNPYMSIFPILCALWTIIMYVNDSKGV